MGIERTWIATKDTVVVSDKAGNGRGPYLLVGPTELGPANPPTRTLLEFQPDYATASGVYSAYLRLTVANPFWHSQGTAPKFWVEKVTGPWSEGTYASGGGADYGSTTNSTTWANQPAAVTTDRVKYEGTPASGVRIKVDVSAIVADHLANSEDPVLRVRLIAADTGTGYDENLNTRRISFRSRHEDTGRPSIEAYLDTDRPPGRPTVTPRTVDPGGTNESPYLSNSLGIGLTIRINDPDAGSYITGTEVQVYPEIATDDEAGNVTGARLTGIVNANQQFAHTGRLATEKYAIWGFTPGQRVRYRVRTRDNRGTWGLNLDDPNGFDCGWSRLSDGWVDLNNPPGAPTGLTTDTTSASPDFSGNHVSGNVGSVVSVVETQVRVTTARGEELVQNTTTFQSGDEALDASIYTTRTGTGGQTVPGGTRWTVSYAATQRPLAPGDKASRRHRTRDQFGRAGAFSAWVSWTIGIVTAPAALPAAGVRQDTLTPGIGAAFSTEFDLMEIRAWSAGTGGQMILDATGGYGVALSPAVSSATVLWSSVVGASPLQWGQQVWVERRVRGVADSTFTPWSERESMPINSLPLPPLVTVDGAAQRSDGVWVVGTRTPRLVAPFRDIDAGDVPTRRISTIKLRSTGAVVHTNTGTVNLLGYYDVPAGALSWEALYDVTVQHADQSGQLGSVSDAFPLLTHQPPDLAAGTAPVAADPTPVVAWVPTFYGGATQAGAVIVIEKETTSGIWDEIHRGTVVGTATSYTVPAGILPAATSVRATVTVTDSMGITAVLSNVAIVTFTATATARAGTASAAMVISSASPADTFTRTVVDGWATASSGFAWTLAGGTAAEHDVTGTEGTVSLATSVVRSPYLGGVAVRDVPLGLKFKADKVPSSGKMRIGLMARFVDIDNNYFSDAQILSTGAVLVRILRVVSGTATLLTDLTVPGLTFTAGTYYRVRFEAVGASPTTLRARVWANSGSEPSTWQVTTTDNTATFQVEGAVGVRTSVDVGVTNMPILVTVDDLTS